ncbi:dTMP kinase [Chakrabartyella piscis]|uniref:dTMP kinase n=1 Tax=Chakrabartyella piscis TaxID=2918914 RepID=UPI0029589CBC|nr:dTMP kinase [Chakrabartyella piscis]
MNGFFISIEGTDGSGKSTQIRKIEAYLQSKNHPFLLTREPGGTQIAERIRDLLLHPEYREMTAKTEMLLYAAARAQHVEELILPTLASGTSILTDRFVDSSIAYQAFGRELGDMVQVVNDIATGGKKPDLTIFLDLPPHLGIVRKQKEENHTMDRLELEANTFHEKVYEGFVALCQKEPDRVKRIDASQSVDAVFAEILRELDVLLMK